MRGNLVRPSGASPLRKRDGGGEEGDRGRRCGRHRARAGTADGGAAQGGRGDVQAAGARRRTVRRARQRRRRCERRRIGPKRRATSSTQRWWTKGNSNAEMRIANCGLQIHCSMNLHSALALSNPGMDFYIVLGLERAAVWRHQARLQAACPRYHPDINPGDRLAEAQFRQIAEAYETLIDPDTPAPLRLDRIGQRADRTGTLRIRRVRFFRQRQWIGGLDVRRFVRRRARPARRAPSGSERRSRRRSPSDDHDRVRSGGSRRPAPADRDAAGALPDVPRRGLAAGGRDALSLVLGSRYRQVGARAHGVLENLPAVRRHRAPAPLPLPHLWRASRPKCAPSRSR